MLKAPGRTGLHGATMLAAALALTACTGGSDDPPSPEQPTTRTSATASLDASPSPSSWDVQPVWEGEVHLRLYDEVPVTMRLYPLQRIGDHVLLTVDYTPQGPAGQRVTIARPFCPLVPCRTIASGANEMLAVSLVDPVGQVRYGPMRAATPGVGGSPVLYGSMTNRSAKLVGTTYRYGVFFPDPGLPAMSVDLVNAGAVPGVPIVDEERTAPGLVVDGSQAGDPTPNPSIETGSGDTPDLVTFPATRPGADAVADLHQLVAPIVGGEVTDYTGTVNLNADVLFAFNSATLTAKAKNVLGRAVQVLADKADPTKPLAVTGHTDNVGTNAYNDRLSAARAKAVAAALQADPATSGWRLQVSGRGESEPVVPNMTPDGTDDPAGRALNRRVEIAYTPKPAPAPSTASSAGASPTHTSPASLAVPTPAATVGPIDVKSHGTFGGAVTALVDPVVVDGGLALIRLSVTPEKEMLHTDAFSRLAASTDTGLFRLVDPKTTTSYLAAHDEGDEDRVLGSEGGFTMHPGRGYTFFVYTAAPPADLSEITVDLGPLGTTTVPLQR